MGISGRGPGSEPEGVRFSCLGVGLSWGLRIRA